MPESVLPYLQSERHFKLYENYIFRIVNNWPNITTFKPEPPHSSVETLSTRIRMCMKSLRNNQWDTMIPFGKFIQIVDEIVVSTAANPGCVTCGPMDSLRKKVPLGTPVETEITQVVPLVNLTNPEQDLLKAVLVLHHHRLLSEPSKVRITTPTGQSYLTTMAQIYDVSVEQEGEEFTIL